MVIRIQPQQSRVEQRPAGQIEADQGVLAGPPCRLAVRLLAAAQ